jgi:hypothetical protein
LLSHHEKAPGWPPIFLLMGPQKTVSMSLLSAAIAAVLPPCVAARACLVNVFMSFMLDVSCAAYGEAALRGLFLSIMIFTSNHELARPARNGQAGDVTKDFTRNQGRSAPILTPPGRLCMLYN